MKILRILPLLLLLLLPATAHAQKPIPTIDQTSQWKALQSYVGKMQSLRNTPASQQTKNAYSTKLQSLRNAANKRAGSLYKQRINRIVAKDSRKEKKQIAKINTSRKQKVASLRSKRSSSISSARASYNSQVAFWLAAYDAKLTSAQSQIIKLRKNLRRTSNPFQRQVILTHIQTVEIKISKLQKSEQRKLSQLKKNYQQKVSDLRARYAARLMQTQNYYSSLVAQVRSAWKVIYRDDVQAARSTKQKQLSRISTLYSRGAGYISAMPPLPS